MKRFSLSEPAEVDILGIWTYVFEQNGDDVRADAAVERLYAAFELLAEQNQIGTPRERLKGARAFTVGSYLVAYLIDGDTIHVLRVSGGEADILKDL